jgi:hypothetical protein
MGSSEGAADFDNLWMVAVIKGALAAVRRKGKENRVARRRFSRNWGSDD